MFHIFIEWFYWMIQFCSEYEVFSIINNLALSWYRLWWHIAEIQYGPCFTCWRKYSTLSYFKLFFFYIPDNYTEHILFWDRYFFRKATFSEEVHFLRTSLFLELIMVSWSKLSKIDITNFIAFACGSKLLQ